MDNGAKLNDIHSSTLGITVTGVQRRLKPQMQAREASVPGRPGTIEYGPPDIGKTEIKVDCIVEAPDAGQLRSKAREIALWLASATSLILDDESDIEWTGRVLAAVDIEEHIIFGKFDFTFSAQPYAVAVAEMSDTIGTAKDYGSPVEFFPLITLILEESKTSLQVSILSSGRFVRVTGQYVTGDEIEFDMAAGKVTRNGTLIMSQVSIDSVWFPVPPGTQTITITPTTGVTGQIIYKKRYL